MLATCFSTAPTVSTSRSAIAGVGAALGHQRQHLELAREDVERPAGISGQLGCADLGVRRRPAGPDAPHGGDEVDDVHDRSFHGR
jgi:hypothetical protein